jgi:glutathione synthase/RimK-type ligase-like ATP-grasp enzyme
MAPPHHASIALATYAEHPSLTPDDGLLAAALARHGLEPVAAPWDDPGMEWPRHDAVVLRSCWDYHHRAPDFAAWLDRLERGGARVHNGVPTLRWNMRKTYLRDLEAAGIPVADTVWVTLGSTTSLAQIAAAKGWTDMVVKPTVSSTGWETWLVERAGDAGDEARFARLRGERDLMVQRFLPGILTEGEVSLIFIAGRFSHAVRKRARPGEFRVHEEYGGTITLEAATAGLVREAARALAAAPEPTLYARVDGVMAGGTLVVTELELVEPKLYFGWGEEAAERMAVALAREVVSGR